MTATMPPAGWRNRTVEIKVWKIVAALLLAPVLVLWLMIVHQNDDIVVLVRNEVVTDADGNRTWYGAYAHGDDQLYRDVAVTIHFLDADNAVVGKTSADTATLAAGQRLALQAALPKEAVRLRIYSVQWRNDRTATMYGPFRDPWEFGYLQYDPAQH